MTEIERYNPQEIEPRWREKWDADRLYRAEVDWDRPKHYALTMLPYPSGDLHIGHWFAMTPSDARARFKRMQGFNVLFPMGFDAFGLPAENAAIQRNIHPYKWTYANMAHMRDQLRSMGAMFDWEREMVSCEPDYYRWTEWFFKTFWEGGLAYRKEAQVNWSPTLQTVLANEQVIDGKDERTGQPVIQKMMEQWFFRITKYADELLNFSGIDWPEPIKLMQQNWIGRSEGANVTFHTEAGDPIEIFTTRPDTLWGATFMVLAPEHQLVGKVTSDEQAEAVRAYVAAAERTTELERSSDTREKTGVFTGGYAINPVNRERIPIWVADYVLITYGSGAIMAVPAHDERDFAFARRYGIEVRPVIQPAGMTEPLTDAIMDEAYVGPGHMINSADFNGTEVGEGKGRKNPSIAAVIDWLEAEGIGTEAINYRMRDWLISRQRYWGSPIPMIYTEDGEIIPEQDENLPVLLPSDVEFLPSGRSPLTYYEPFISTTDPQGRPARRETDTMDTFMCSSWYWYRYTSPGFAGAPIDPDEAAYWLPVDTYTGGAEHATMHLLYARFFNKAMRDTGVFDATISEMREHGVEPKLDEPFMQLRNQGQILGEERIGHTIIATGAWDDGKLVADHVRVVTPADAGSAPAGSVAGEIMRRTERVLQVATGEDELITVEVAEGAAIEIPGMAGEARVEQLLHHLEIQRMSKSKGNVVNPDELVAKYGTDTVRGYLMFAFDWVKGGPWDSKGILGVQRYLNDVWRMVLEPAPDVAPHASEARAVRRKLHQTIMRVSDSLEQFSFNTGMAALMELKNTMVRAKANGAAGTPEWDEAVRGLLLMMAPYTPHIAEELWGRIGGDYSIHHQSWPEADAEAAREDEIEIAVQVNGKVRARLTVPADVSADDAKARALAHADVQAWLNGEPRKVIYVPGKLVNIVA